jgi:uncharacterized protein YfdQ (DUF2303 family)
MEPNEPNAKIIADLGRATATPRIITEAGLTLAALPRADGSIALIHLERYAATPTDIRQHVRLATIKDHVHYVLRQQRAGRPNTVVFADRKLRKLTTIMEYHQPEQPSWMHHRVTTILERSQQLQTWLTTAGQWMTQDAFGEFLDANLSDIQKPEPATVLNFVEQLECTRKEYFRSAKNSTTGEVQFAWGKENEPEKETAKIVKEFTLGIPIWHRGEPIAIQARLQHNIKEHDGKASVQFRFKLEHIDRIEDKLWEELLAKLSEELKHSATVLEGTEPEAPATSGPDKIA